MGNAEDIARTVVTAASLPRISHRAQIANPFRAMVFGAMADEMIAAGTDVVKLSLGEPDFGAPPAVRDAMREQYDGRPLPYTAAMGLPELRQAISDFYRERHHVDVDPKRIAITAGGSTALLLSAALTVNEGDEVLIADPSYPCNRELVRAFGGKVVDVPTSAATRFHLTPESCREYWSERTKAVMITSPSNPTGTTITKDQLQGWVDYANKNKAVIIYDAAYEAYISEENVAHSIYECEGAKTCAIELKSFSKNAGFTGVRLGYTVVPKELKCGEVSLNAMWARRHGTKFNGAPYIVQRAGEAVYSEAGKAQLKEQVAYYMKNAKAIKQGLKDAGYTVFGGVNAPYIWLKTPGEMTSWEFFDDLLARANVVGTPGSGFGPSGEGYFRLTAFGSYENTLAALERIKML